MNPSLLFMIGIGFNNFNNKHGGYDKIQDENYGMIKTCNLISVYFSFSSSFHVRCLPIISTWDGLASMHGYIIPPFSCKMPSNQSRNVNSLTLLLCTKFPVPSSFTHITTFSQKNLVAYTSCLISYKHI